MDSSTDIDTKGQRLTKFTKKLMVMFMQSFITAVFVADFGNFSFYDTEGSGFRVLAEQIVNVTAREFCSVVSRDLYSLENMGYVDETRLLSKRLSLEISGAQDVHYVFVNTTHVPWTVACSLDGMEFDRTNNKYGLTQPVSLLSSLVDLTAKYGIHYGIHRLNVLHINLEDMLEFSPFQCMGLDKHPALAKFVVELVLL
ncbi:hypothetical protein QTP88_029292 [Uroleucon formosanum]